MSARRGVLSAGTWCVDFNKSIARWPDEDTSNEVLAIDRQNGGSGSNMAFDLKRLDPNFPVEAMGLVGDDDLGRFLFQECDALGVDRTALCAAPGGATMSVDAFNVAANGRRTHFYHQGVAAEMTPDDFDFSSTRAKILHLGLPGAHKAMDLPWQGDASGWAAVARENDDVLALGSIRWAAAHFPEGGVVVGRDGSRLALGSVALPVSAIVGANGAGDAFAAGLLYGLHEQWPMTES